MLEHPWPANARQAINLQNSLKHRVVREASPLDVHYVAGVDVGFENRGRITRAAVAVLSFPGLELVEHAIARRATSFPYVPGLLSFRELPAVLDACRMLQQLPDVWLCDGQGYAHPRRFGIACHLGVVLDQPAIGVAKSRLTGHYATLGEEKGSRSPLLDHDEVVGMALRTRRGCLPLYVSLGHRISLEQSVELVMACTTRFKLPETTRHAHRLASG